MIPQPVYGQKSEQNVMIEAVYSCKNAALVQTAEVLADAMDRLWNVRLVPGEGGIVFELDENLAQDAYEIVIEADSAKACVDSDTENAGKDAAENGFCIVRAGSAEGAGYAAATLAQIGKTAGKKLLLPAGKIQDKPQSSWRGLMVDLARDWHPLPVLFAYVDLCWFYKIDRFQLHFTDDQSYTLPSKVFPQLCTPGRTYTPAELTLLSEYAKKRGVMLVPEIDFPGHSGQFNAKCPEVFGGNGILCCEEKTFEGIDKLLTEICELFPDSPYLHIGGDEARIAKWDECPGCRAYREEKGLADVHALYAHYVDRLAKMVLAKGKTPIAWEGFAKEYNDMVTKDLILFAWENYYQPAPDLAEGGFTLINASWKPNYVVTPAKMWSREEILEWNPYRWTHWWEKSKAYNTWISVPESTNVLGGQLCAWGDCLIKNVNNYEAAAEEFDRVAERLPAVAERTWKHTGEPAQEEIWTAVAQKAARLTGAHTVLQAMKDRRSIRRFKADMVPKVLIDQVLEAGLYAASGRGQQCVITVAVTNKEIRDQLAAVNARIMGREGTDPFYGAPVILIVLADKNWPTHVYDGSLVMGNLMLAAHDLGLGSCWIHRAREEFRQKNIRSF